MRQRRAERVDSTPVTAERMFPSGGWEISAVVAGQLVRRRFFDYTKREAIQAFRDEVFIHTER